MFTFLRLFTSTGISTNCNIIPGHAVTKAPDRKIVKLNGIVLSIKAMIYLTAPHTVLPKSIVIIIIQKEHICKEKFHKFDEFIDIMDFLSEYY